MSTPESRWLLVPDTFRQYLVNLLADLETRTNRQATPLRQFVQAWDNAATTGADLQALRDQLADAKADRQVALDALDAISNFNPDAPRTVARDAAAQIRAVP